MFGAVLAGTSMMSAACTVEDSAGDAAGGSAGSALAGAGGGKAAGAGGSTTAGAGGSTTAGKGGASGSTAGGAAGASGSTAGGAAGASGSTAGGAAGASGGTGGSTAAGAGGAGGAPSVCTPGQYVCNGQDLQKCDAQGATLTTEKTCTSGESCNASKGTCDALGTLDPTKGYMRFAQVAPSALQTAYDVCIRAAGSTNWDTSSNGDATQIFKDSGDPGEFYYPTISTYFEFPVAGNYEFRFVKGDAANCDTPSTKLPGGAGGFYALTVPAGQIYTLVIYDTDGSGQEKALDIVALASPAATSGKATVTWANAMSNVPGLDFGSVVGNQFSDLQLGVAKKSSAIGLHDPVTALIGSIRSDDVNNKIHSVTAAEVELGADGIYTTFAYGVNEFAVGKLKPGIAVCNDLGLGTVAGTSTIAAGCVYSAP